MTSATIRPTMMDLGVISRTCGGLTDGTMEQTRPAALRGEYAGVRLRRLLDSLLCAERDAAQDRPDDVRHREAEPLVLIGVEVHAIDTARRRHGPGIEELALALFRNGRQCCRQSGGLLCGAFELRRDCALGFLNLVVARRSESQARACPARSAPGGSPAPVTPCLALNATP